MAIGRRCPMGCATWPDQLLYQHCLYCGEKTRRTRNTTPMPTDEALSVLLHAEFEKFYVRWCVERGQGVEGPLPDAEDDVLETAG